MDNSPRKIKFFEEWQRDKESNLEPCEHYRGMCYPKNSYRMCVHCYELYVQRSIGKCSSS